MNRLLQTFNLLGVCVLACLCVFQWQANRQLNLRTLAQENIYLEQVAQLAERDKQIRGSAADLDEFRDRLRQNQTDLSDMQGKLSTASAEREQLATECKQLKTVVDGLKTSLEQWTAAVVARDQALKQSAEQAQGLAKDRYEALQKFNDLAAKYNTAADDLKQAGQTISKLIADRNDAVAKFNDLATKYNQIIKELNTANTRP